jgi:hypothetical protein
MPRHRLVVLGTAALLALLASSCHSTRVDTSTSATTTTTTTAATSSTGTPSTATPGPLCPAANDMISGPLPEVDLQAPGSLSRVKVTNGRALPCSSVIRVDGMGAANFTFGTVAACQFQQDLQAKTATAIAREPDGTLMRVQEGVVYCTTKGGRRLRLCGSGDIQLNGDVNQVKATCDPDPVFEVEVNMGFADVRDPSGVVSQLGQGLGLGYDFGKRASNIAGTNFGPPDLAIFQRQAARLGLSVPTTTTSSSTTTTSSSTTTSTATTTTTTVVP